MNVSSQDKDPRKVFLVHGRDRRAREALVALLTAFGLEIIDWGDAAAASAGGGAPFTANIVDAGIRLSRAVVVLFTPDDIGYVHPDLREENDERYELEPTGQPRLNVVFEAGMAMGHDRDHVVLVEVGHVRKMSDIAGVNFIHMDDSIERRKELARRLEGAELRVDTASGKEWITAGSFNHPSRIAVDLTSALGRLTSPQSRSAVNNSQQVTGVITCLRAPVRAHILVRSSGDLGYWRQGGALRLREGGGFEASATFGRSETHDAGKEYTLMLVAATPDASASFQDSKGQRMSSLPPGIQLLDEVTVTRR